jgi:hypothetical protein
MINDLRKFLYQLLRVYYPSNNVIYKKQPFNDETLVYPRIFFDINDEGTSKIPIIIENETVASTTPGFSYDVIQHYKNKYIQYELTVEIFQKYDSS